MMFIRLGLLTQYVPHVIGRIESPYGGSIHQSTFN